jgi:hypothetical protein
MLNSYQDIRKRIPDPPLWFDENGTPRYDEFHPSQLPNIYAKEAVLYEIGCQSCDKRFLVATCEHRLAMAKFMDLYGLATTETWISSSLRNDGGSLHYGDPPAHDCVGDTMNCLDFKVVQFWRRDPRTLSDWVNWVRVPELEGVLLEDGRDDQ